MKQYYVATTTYKTYYTGTARLALTSAKKLVKLYQDAQVACTLGEVKDGQHITLASYPA